MNLPPIVALEVGTSKVRALVGEARDDGHLMITGLGECPSRGVRKGEIVDFDNALACVRSAIQLAEENGRVTIQEVHLVITGGHIRSLVNKGSVPILDPAHEITAGDVDHVMDTARAVNLPQDRQILHTVSQHFHVDDQPGVIDPVGMEGSKLSLDMLIIHGVLNRLRNVVRVVRSAQLEVADVAFSGLCAGLAVLTPEEKEAGVAVIDLGGGTTDYVVYARSAIAAAGCFGVGGDHVTNDIWQGLRISPQDAEHLKETSGSATVDLATRSQKLPLAADSAGRERWVRMSDLHTIMHLRMEEILGLVRAEIISKNLLHALGQGIVLTGGCAHMKNVAKLAEKVFDLPCRIGRPKGIAGLATVSEGPEYAAPVGLVRLGFKSAIQRPGLVERLKKSWKGFFGR